MLICPTCKNDQVKAISRSVNAECASCFQSSSSYPLGLVVDCVEVQKIINVIVELKQARVAQQVDNGQPAPQQAFAKELFRAHGLCGEKWEATLNHQQSFPRNVDSPADFSPHFLMFTIFIHCWWARKS